MLTEQEIIIRDRLIEAAYVDLRQSVRGVRPAGAKGFWPEIIRSAEEVAETARERARDRITDDAPRGPLPTSAEISRADEATSWLALLESDRARRYVAHRMMCYARGWSWSAHCKKFGWVKRTADHNIEAALKSLSRKVRNKGISLQLADEKTIAHLGPVYATTEGKMGQRAA